METIEEENHHMCLLAYPFLLLCLVQQCLLPINAHCPTLFSAVLPVAHTLFGPVMPEKAQTKTMFSVHTSCSFPKHTHTHTPACYCGSTQEFARAPVELPRLEAFIDFFLSRKDYAGIRRCPGFLLNILRAPPHPLQTKKTITLFSAFNDVS